MREGAKPPLFPFSFKGEGAKESQREAKPLLQKQFPLSFEGEGDQGGEVDK